MDEYLVKGAQAIKMFLQKWFEPIMNLSHVFWSISRHVRSLDTLSLTYIDLVRLLFFLFLFQDLSTILILIRTRILQPGRIYLHCVSYYYRPPQIKKTWSKMSVFKRAGPPPLTFHHFILLIWGVYLKSSL